MIKNQIFKFRDIERFLARWQLLGAGRQKAN
jgi:hypothetical protein